jgi:uncharacterized protein (UPF0147 family)
VLIDINSKNKQVIMDSDTPEHIKRAAENAIQNFKNHQIGTGNNMKFF